MNPTHSKVPLAVHVVWATKRRSPLLAEANDGSLLTLLRGAVPDDRGFVRAFGASDDHVHVLVDLAATARLCDLVQCLKGVSALRWNQHLPHGASPLRWQDGYWARSVSPDEDAALLHYIHRQREHHRISHDPEPWELPGPRTRG